jgi:hypothetical protein
MHDAVAHGVGAAEPVDRRVELERVGLRGGRLQVLGAQQLVTRPEQTQLQAARPSVDNQNPQKGQTQSRTSSMSSPTSRV